MHLRCAGNNHRPRPASTTRSMEASSNDRAAGPRPPHLPPGWPLTRAPALVGAAGLQENAESAVGGDGRFREQRRHHRAGGHQPAGDARLGAHPPGPIRQAHPSAQPGTPATMRSKLHCERVFEGSPLNARKDLVWQITSGGVVGAWARCAVDRVRAPTWAGVYSINAISKGHAGRAGIFDY